jgi:hypothetical protein
MSGAERARPTRSSGEVVPIAPFCEPWSRRWRVSRRVSTSAMPTTPWRARYASSDYWARQLEGMGVASRTTKPATRGTPSTASLSSELTPTLPISGAVMVTICP